MTAYRPTQVNQLDGSKYAGLNCCAAVGAIALDRETLGKKTSTGAIVRNWTGDTNGGLRQQQVADAIEKAYKVDLDVRIGIAIPEAAALLDKGHGMMLAGQSAATIGTRWQASETFKGNHQWFVNERRNVGGAFEYLVYDPLADGRRPGIAKSPFWVPHAIVMDFARRLDLDGHGKRLGDGRFYSVFTHDTEPHLVLRFGGTLMTPPVAKTIKVPKGRRANVRTGPGTQFPIVQRLANGAKFTAVQVTHGGMKLAGSRTWYGNIDGTRWLHDSSF